MSNYKKTSDAQKLKLAERLQQDLPPIMTQYLHKRGTGLSANTLLSYTNKLSVFAEFLCSRFTAENPKEISLEDIRRITPDDIIDFIYWLQKEHVIIRGSETVTLMPNSKSSVNNYLSCISAFFTRLVREGIIPLNPALAIDRPKEQKNEVITYLKPEEKAKFLQSVEYGTGFDVRQLKFHEKNKERDIAICQLLLGTGIRISELVGLDVSDVNFSECSILVTRKRNKRQEVYFSDLTSSYLQDYLEKRDLYHPQENEKALFLSRSGTRLGVRSMEKLVKKYISVSLPLLSSSISPHKMRSTYAINMLEKSSDIDLVRETLGHSSFAVVNRYAKTANQKRKAVRNLLEE